MLLGFIIAVADVAVRVLLCGILAYVVFASESWL
jgi:hypothetical protein